MTKINATRKETVAWVLLIGVWGAFVSAVMGAIACITIVGIPVGIKHFKFIKLIFTTDDVAVTYRPDLQHRTRGLYWYIFGGAITKALISALPSLLGLANIGDSIVIRFEKIAPYLSCPFDVEILENGRYSQNGATVYDYKLLQRRIYKSPTTAIFDEKRNKLITVRRYIKGFENDVFSIKRSTQIVFFLFAGIFVFGVASLIGNWANWDSFFNLFSGDFTDIGKSWGIFVGLLLFFIGFIGMVTTNVIQTSHLLRIHDNYMKPLFELFEDTDPYDMQPAKISLSYVFDRLYKDREERRYKQNTNRN